MVKSVGADDLVHFIIKEDKSGWAIYLDDKKMHHVEDYKIEQAQLPGTAKLTLAVLVKYP